ncbi:TonB-dependent siderophore receptor [Xanthomonas oryzae]|uniref:TonB-dependent siderophore receptor n=1 Tax=Xanthomonas oryzae TaxID=347 RepID=UPI000464FD87|nr:TonB-dependent siderophore receptor [Xanthomonas oryzae]ALS94316.1 ligand-gated channel [Xanthomonas oryzae pv. oryzae]AUI91121.1 TonB-dependent siderophore receptor [Xanthomonas oryzae pv. oryzae]AUI94793.1 TonB-dependent siderophore receptor [Xanthomonas oryzae pv. oryzae]AUI98465.1 TonB-dependent siderophore receptor [Xanthomonas oryzae pv. oryzae]AUJ02142.1 TonB-dependent siderophore receptor [Xanthomonas oryzae pv. oryzae]
MRPTLLVTALALHTLPAFAQQAAAPAVTELDDVDVVGRAQTLYKSEDAAVATRTDTPLALVPQSVQVLPRELIDDQAARQITDLYRSISGISFFSYAGVTLRGFRQENVLYDGLRSDPYAGFSVPQLFNIERVEVLKGPAGALYGSGEPGGVINYVTQKPGHQAARRVELQVGNQSFGAASFEATGPVREDGRIRYRIGAYADGEDGFRWNTDSQSQIGDASVAFDIGNTGELTLQYTDITQNLGGNRLRGVPVDNAGNFLTDRRWNHNEPTDFLDMRAKVAFAQYRFAPSSAWNVDMALRWFKNDEHQIYHEPMGLIDRNRDGTAEWMTRQLRNQYRDNDAISSNVNAVLRTSTGTIEHKLLMGADSYRLDANFRAQTANTADTGRVRGPVPGIDLLNPVYGRSGFYDYGLDILPWRATSTRSQRYGTYLQDELTLTSRWYAMAGLRWDGFKDDNLLDGSRVTGNDLSWRVGSTFVLREGINAYASYASGFLPQDAANQDSSAGGPFAPERSTQWEVGLKTALNDGGLTFNTALYRIERSNIVQANGRIVDGVNQLSALGLVRSEGLEGDVLADLTERWVLNLTYAYNDARVLDAGTNGITNASGNRFANAPRNTFGLWTRYDLPAWRSAIAFGADYVGERVSLDGQRVKPYAIYDISWQTHWDAWKLQINIKNLFDKVYAVSGFNTRAGHFPGEPRRIYAQLAYRF